MKQIKHTISLVEISRSVHKMIFQFYCIIKKIKILKVKEHRVPYKVTHDH